MTARKTPAVLEMASGSIEPSLLDEVVACHAWALSTYSRCEFRCVYCVTGMQGVSTPRYSVAETRERLRSELAAHPGAYIGVGGLCDAYPDVEREHRVTRAALGVLVEEERSFGVTTKGTTVLRDTDLLRRGRDVRVNVSLSGTDDALLRRVDPRAPTVAARLGVVRALVDAGIHVNVTRRRGYPESPTPRRSSAPSATTSPSGSASSTCRVRTSRPRRSPARSTRRRSSRPTGGNGIASARDPTWSGSSPTWSAPRTEVGPPVQNSRVVE